MEAPVPRTAPAAMPIASIFAAIACITTAGIGLSLSMPLLSFTLEARGGSGTLIGLTAAMGGLANILLAPFVPRLVARYGARAVLAVGIAIAVLTLPVFKVAEDVVWWFPLRFAFGAALCILFVVSEFWITAAAPERSRGLVMGIYATALSLGFAAGPALLAVTGSVGWLPFVAGTLLMLAAALPVLVAKGQAPEIHDVQTRSIGSLILVAPAATLAAFVFGAVETGMFSFQGIFGTRIGMTEAQAALLLTAVFLGTVLFQIPIGLLSDRMDRRVLLALIGVISTLGIALAALVAHHTWLLMAVMFVAGGMLAGLYTVGLAHLASRFRGADLAGANAAFVMLYAAGLMVGPPVIGAGLDAWNPWGYLATIGVFIGLYTVVAIGQALRPERG